MKRDNPFDRLWASAGKTWAQDEIDRFFDEMKRMDFSHEPIEKYDGYRRTEVNGDVTEEVLTDDGEWRSLDEVEQNNQTFDVAETDDGYILTLDVSKYLPLRDFDASATLNNGVLEVSFTSKE